MVRVHVLILEHPRWRTLRITPTLCRERCFIKLILAIFYHQHRRTKPRHINISESPAFTKFRPGFVGNYIETRCPTSPSHSCPIPSWHCVQHSRYPHHSMRLSYIYPPLVVLILAPLHPSPSPPILLVVKSISTTTPTTNMAPRLPQPPVDHLNQGDWRCCACLYSLPLRLFLS
jgi:hypothetical protein